MGSIQIFNRQLIVIIQLILNIYMKTNDYIIYYKFLYLIKKKKKTRYMFAIK